jgi:hypothetical protein
MTTIKTTADLLAAVEAHSDEIDSVQKVMALADAYADYGASDERPKAALHAAVEAMAAELEAAKESASAFELIATEKHNRLAEVLQELEAAKATTYRQGCKECADAKQVHEFDAEWKRDLAKGREIIAAAGAAQPAPQQKRLPSGLDRLGLAQPVAPQQEPTMTFEQWLAENQKYIEPIDIFPWLSAAFEAGRKAQPVAQPVAWLCQHNETGRTRILMEGDVFSDDGRWVMVGPLYLGEKK